MSISGKDLSSFSLYSIKISNNSCEGFQFGRSIINQRYFKKFPVKENWNFYLEPAKREKKKKSIYFFVYLFFLSKKATNYMKRLVQVKYCYIYFFIPII